MFGLGRSIVCCPILDPRVLCGKNTRRIGEIRQGILAFCAHGAFDSGRQFECACGTDSELARSCGLHR